MTRLSIICITILAIVKDLDVWTRLKCLWFFLRIDFVRPDRFTAARHRYNIDLSKILWLSRRHLLFEFGNKFLVLLFLISLLSVVLQIYVYLYFFLSTGSIFLTLDKVVFKVTWWYVQLLTSCSCFFWFWLWWRQNKADTQRASFV